MKELSENIAKISYSKDKLSIFKEYPPNQRGFILLRLSKRPREEILKKLSVEEIVELLKYLDPDEATDLIQGLPKRKRNEVIKNLSQNLKEKVQFLLRFNPKTAAGLMSLNYIEIEENKTFKELSEIIKKHEARTGKFPTILVVKNGFLKGEIPGHVLIFGKENELISNYIKKIPKIKYNQSELEVVKIFKAHPHEKIVVLDKDNSILGVIYSDDILNVIERHSSNSLYNFAGVKEEEDVFDSAFIKVKNRYKWLIINLGTAFLAASVVSLFRHTISKWVLLAVYMPIVAGMGGNAGTQTLAVVVRGLTLNEIEFKTAKTVIINEIIAGAINGIINGCLVALVATFWNKSPLLGLIVGVAMIINLIIAGFFGVIVPLFMKFLGKDPATSATIFITTATDVFGFLAFLGLAHLIL